MATEEIASGNKKYLLNNESFVVRYFISYTGVKLPLKLTNELKEADMGNRITYFIGYYDAEDCLRKIEKVVYGEIEFTHEYTYDEKQSINKAIITEDDEEPRILVFDHNGMMTEV